MPYAVFQGGRRRKRRRWPRLLAVLVLLGVGLGAGLTLRAAARAEAARAGHADGRRRRCSDAGTAPLAGGGTAPSPLAVRLDDPRDPVAPALQAPAALGADVRPRHRPVLWRRDPTRVLPIASLTKMMTALLVADRVPPDAKVRITKEALHYKGSGVGLLAAGQRIPVKTMLYGLLLPSGNDAAIALAQRAGDGSRKRFVRDDEPRGAGDGPACARTSRRPTASSTAATTRARPTSRRSPARCCASRGWPASCAAARPCCRSRSRAASSTSTTTTRCCSRATAARRASRRATRTRPAAASWRPCGAAGAARRRAAALAGPRHAGAQAARPRLPGLSARVTG